MREHRIIDKEGMSKIRFGEIKWLMFVTVMTLSGCYYDNVTDLYPNGCNVIDVSYSRNITPILDANCVTCHNDISQQGGVILEEYEYVIPYVENGKLMGSIQHDDGFEPMPMTGGKLTNCQIKKFQSWIDAGALDN
jgi:hypothetical protein